MLIKEFCAENFEHVAEAIDAGAKRIELCDNLAVGGTTPSYGVIAHTCEYALSHGVAVMTMIRPRGGNFVYSDEEVEMMLDDIEAAAAKKMEAAVEFAMNSPEPDPAHVLDDVFYEG